ncbi:MAG: hypothetical protein J6A90_07120 [Clostridia bacterium]|nr:hypothetical protein [Clostridia bacterium]
MKKKLLIALVVVSLIVCVFAACGKECEHNWQEGPTTATCDTAGQTTMTCSLCGATTQKTAAALGHEWEFVETVAATCQAGGYDLYECKREGCDATDHQNETKVDFSPAGHNYQPENVPPTCDKAGYTENTCTICGNGDGNRVTLPKLGHTFQREDFDGENGVVPTYPTCEENGYITYNCMEEGCGYKEVVTYEQLLEKGETELAAMYEKLGHNFTVLEDYADPTCTVAGYMINGCANGCGKSEKVATDPALGHSYERADSTEATYTYKQTLAPTCITEGYEWVVCTVEDCGYCTEEAADKDEEYVAAYRRAIEATGVHVFDKNPTVVAPLCDAQGYTTYSCSADGACTATEDRDFVDALGHEMVLTESLLTDGKPTCVTNGNYPYNCTRCDFTDINLNGEENNGARHTFVAGEYTYAPTCITRGIYTCSVCDQEFEAYDDDTAAMPHGNHVFNVKGETTAPTCSEYGYTTYGCSADGKCVATEKRDYVARAGHTFGEPTENGTIVCEACSATYINETTVIKTEEHTLCKHDNGETCDTCGIGVIITGTKTPDAPAELAAGVQSTTTFDKGAALIELKGDVGTTYTIVVYGANGEAITSYDVVEDGTDIGKINVVTSANGSCIVDITEIEAEVASIAITASAAATVSFYVTVK